MRGKAQVRVAVLRGRRSVAVLAAVGVSFGLKGSVENSFARSDKPAVYLILGKLAHLQRVPGKAQLRA